MLLTHVSKTIKSMEKAYKLVSTSHIYFAKKLLAREIKEQKKFKQSIENRHSLIELSKVKIKSD